ncbi:hypothetical protein [Conexibacter woesei]|uniref:Uncharacterized protein n=1 Tax=Conexibacter woesei (strain DSM 14684 / CCUG 47730 / CIP 108061 / JCM 11494 / NBRC 100937 / ID131577) TaxID=469383 RepID=D3F8R9_CONWI|nr:hypothetical protein [Conexibacter woesei]ADB51033.1 hypothetical protein Cwoe_2614 [Conexibacter woesei DSM 14684]
MALLEHIIATDASALEEISRWLRDGSCEPAAVHLDAAARTLTLPFEQEWRGEPAAGPPRRHLRRTWLYDEYELPHLAGRLLVHGATTARARDVPAGAVTLAGVAHVPAIGGVRVDYGDGGWLEVAADALLVELEVSDRVGTLMRNRVGRLIPFSSTFEARGRAPG